jgi:hypothetical protein
MKEIDYTVCPNCGDEDTGQDADWVYDYGWSSRICDGDKGCGTKYKVYWETKAVKVEIMNTV